MGYRFVLIEQETCSTRKCLKINQYELCLYITCSHGNNIQEEVRGGVNRWGEKELYPCAVCAYMGSNNA